MYFLSKAGAPSHTQNREYEMSGPSVLWCPLSADTRLEIGAGSIGSYLLLNDRILSDAIGLIAEAAELRMFVQQPVMLSFERDDTRGQELEYIFERIIVEAHQEQFGTEITISGYVRLLLVLLWRSVDKQSNDQELIGGHKAKLNQFRNLVEAHFRTRWQAKHYADALGLTYDRLHDLCIRALDKPPALLIRERSLREAQILLQRTSHSVDHISALLGFSSASQFNHFFKAMSGEAPGSFRRRFSKLSEDTLAGSSVRFSDWP
ncbi:MAG: helix-turn-helix domain-containing protein [Paracoccaceae bacterium]